MGEDQEDQGGGSPFSAPQAWGPLATLQQAAQLSTGGLRMEDLDAAIRPETQHLAFAAGMLKPAWGGFGEALANAFGEQASAQMKEAELRAKYLPQIAQAQMQRQLQMMQIAAQQQKLIEGYRDAGVGSLTGLLSLREPLTGSHVVQALGAEVDRGTLPQQMAQSIYTSLPVNDPTRLRQEIQRLAVSRMGGNEAFGAVTPKVDMQDIGPGIVPVQTNPNAGAPVGPLAGGQPLPKGLAPGERFKPGEDQAGNPIVTDLADSTVRRPTPAVGGPQPMTVSGLEAEKGLGGDAKDYVKSLNDKVSTMRELSGRFNEMRDKIGNFTPGALGEYRQILGSWVKDIGQTLGLSPEAANALATKLAKGDIGDAQAFQKLAIQGAMEAVRAAQGSAQNISNADFAAFLKSNPSLATDPKALDSMMNYATDQYRKATTEQNELFAYRDAGGDLAKWPSVWNQRSIELGLTKPVKTTGTARGSLPSTPQTRSAVGTSNSGRRIKQMPDGSFVYE